MLDALSDFWKPNKKSQSDKIRVDQLQIGSAVVFGFVPQASLSGRRLQVTAINTYKFGTESLTSFVLLQDRDPGISMIIAESDGEQYLAISRRITISDRIKMFNSAELENILEKPDVTQLSCKENAEFKGWTVPSYRREIQGMKGVIFAGDFRKTPIPADSAGQEFKYTLLASDNNEHAIEIEKYPDGRVEMYATVYRRTSDIGEVASPRPDLQLAKTEEAPKAEAPKVEAPKAEVEEKKPMLLTPRTEPKAEEPKAEAKPAEAPKPAEQPKQEAVKPETKPEVAPEPKQEVKQPTRVVETPASPIKLQEFPEKPKAEEPKAETKPEPKTEQVAFKPEAAAPAQVQPASQQEKSNMQAAESTNGVSPKFSSAAANAQQENKPMTKANGASSNEAVECELRVANKIIDEAIRNEMRLSDVVRRIIELPVAHQEAVHIPLTLSDEDYALLGIRYGISASDKGAIKARIIEDLNSFSGKKAA